MRVRSGWCVSAADEPDRQPDDTFIISSLENVYCETGTRLTKMHNTKHQTAAPGKGALAKTEILQTFGPISGIIAPYRRQTKLSLSRRQ
ncbi:hypothetical protein LDENG_00190220 [Lucifuga dentata]|nr:hypothetical protein LDENG_00190220 [Lucifuga dentata]